MATAEQLVIVTGSAGYLGTALVGALTRAYRVVGLDLKAPRRVAPGTDLIACNLTKDDSVASALSAIRQRHGDDVTSCVHLAAHYDFSGEASPLYRDLTIERHSAAVARVAGLHGRAVCVFQHAHRDEAVRARRGHHGVVTRGAGMGLSAVQARSRDHRPGRARPDPCGHSPRWPASTTRTRTSCPSHSR